MEHMETQAAQLPWHRRPTGMAPRPGRVCAFVCVCGGGGRERALLSASTRLGNGCLAGLPDLSQPLLSQTTRFS